ncbi:MAG TPA: AbrB/MazE/SpoVT family DNA-binding domain-containing protein [Candidatus Nanoarchaeia archaeon]|nr:AbrB/MazE/SpoVT family DNA-binding domain-containing protein [Candidatus Nanoarchaeia archaeon]
MEVETKIRKWGNSYGVILPKSVIETGMFSDNDEVIVKIKKKKKDLSELAGLWKFKRPIEEIMKDIKEGYDD